MSLVPFVHVEASLDGRSTGDRIALSDEDRHHLRRVLRLPDGGSVEVADGQGRSAPAQIAGAHLVLGATAAAEPPLRPELWLAQALPKGRKLDEVVRRATELGVDGILVVVAGRSVGRLPDDRAARARQRWRAVARAACEQARRSRRPELVGPVTPTELAAEPGQLLVATLDAPPLPAALDGLADLGRITIAIGPEGGWSPEEGERFAAAGAVTVGLGPTVLRTEHAGPAALAVTAALVGRWSAVGARGHPA